MKRGSIKKDECKQIPLWVPTTMVPLIDRGVELEDSDRSKFIRNAIREKLARHNLADKGGRQ
jgi:metal-responsive CopG/Arc/MetJ family transcriptional regulator